MYSCTTVQMEVNGTKQRQKIVVYLDTSKSKLNSSLIQSIISTGLSLVLGISEKFDFCEPRVGFGNTHA